MAVDVPTKVGWICPDAALPDYFTPTDRCDALQRKIISISSVEGSVFLHVTPYLSFGEVGKEVEFCLMGEYDLFKMQASRWNVTP